VGVNTTKFSAKGTLYNSNCSVFGPRSSGWIGKDEVGVSDDEYFLR